MPTLLLYGRGVAASLEGEHIYVKDHRVKPIPHVQTLPFQSVSRVVLMGDAVITSPLLLKLLDRKIPTVFMTTGGRVRGTLCSPVAAADVRLLRQVKQQSDTSYFYYLLYAVLHAKVYNQGRVLKRLLKTRETPSSTLLASLAQLEAVEREFRMDETARMLTENELRGLEGTAARLYFSSLAQLLPPQWKFQGRRRYPSKDPVNALLSFCYALLTGSFIQALVAHGLNPAIGPLHHADRSGRPGLALDLIEPFRPCVDLLAISLLTHHQLKESDFKLTAEGCRLMDNGRKVVLKAYEAFLVRRVRGHHATSAQSWGEAIEQAVCHYSDYLELRTMIYSSFLLS